jgi:hypothetical protein
MFPVHGQFSNLIPNLESNFQKLEISSIFISKHCRSKIHSQFGYLNVKLDLSCLHNSFFNGLGERSPNKIHRYPGMRIWKLFNFILKIEFRADRTISNSTAISKIKIHKLKFLNPF